MREIHPKRRRRMLLTAMLVLLAVALALTIKAAHIWRGGASSSGSAIIGGPGAAPPAPPSEPSPQPSGTGGGGKPAWGDITLDRGQATQTIGYWYADSGGIRLQVMDITRVSDGLAEPPQQHVEVRLEGGRLVGPTTLWDALSRGPRGDAEVVTHVSFEAADLPPDGAVNFVLPVALMAGDSRGVTFAVVPDFGATVIHGTLTDTLHTTTFEIPVPRSLQQVRYWRVTAPDPARVAFSFGAVLPASTAELTIDRGGDAVHFESPDGGGQRVLLTVGPIDPAIFDSTAHHVTQIGGTPTITRQPTATLVLPRGAAGELTARIRSGEFTPDEKHDYYRQSGLDTINYYQTTPWDSPAPIPIAPLPDTQKPDGSDIITAPGIPAAPTTGPQQGAPTTGRTHSVLPLAILVVAAVLGALALRRRRKGKAAVNKTEGSV